MVTTKPFPKTWNNSLSHIKLKPKSCTTYIELWKRFGTKDEETDRNESFH